MLDAITWTANPILFNHGVTIRWYGVMFIIGFFLGYKILARISGTKVPMKNGWVPYWCTW